MFSSEKHELYDALKHINTRLNYLTEMVNSLQPAITSGPRQSPYPPLLGGNTDVTPVVLTGIVVEALAHIGAYRVQLSVPNPMIWASSLRYSTCSPSGAMTYGGYKPGDTVVVLVSKNMPMGVILGAMPPADSLGRMSYHISQTSGVDFGVSSSAEIARLGGAPNCSNGIPVDDATGAFGVVTETGIIMHVDSFMACLKLSEITGLFLFYWDELLRIAGRNFQLWASGRLLEAFNDDGEFGVYSGDCIYPWELLGAIDKDAQATLENNEEALANKLWANVKEPMELDQKPFHRLFGYGGYLGMGKKLYVVIPNQEWLLQRYERNKPDIGVFDAGVSLSGAAGVRTAASFLAVKSPIIVSPHRKREPNDPTGDSQWSGYKPSGVGGQPIEAAPRWEDDELRGLASPMAATDAAAHFFNIYTTTPIQEHKKDFLYIDEKKYANEVLGGVKGEYAPDYAALVNGGVLPLPPKTTLKVDHRHTADIYHSTAYIAVLEDGSIAIGDGYGAEIRMGGGKLFISAPGGVFLQSGREIALLAGGDIAQTARGSVDIVSKRDIRLAAAKNLHLAGAIDGGAHGVLIESRSTMDDPSWYFTGKSGEATTIGGIRLLCPYSKLVAYSKDTHVVAHGLGSDAGTIKLEATTLGGGEGSQAQTQGDIILTGNNVYHNVDCAVFNCFTNDDMPRDRSPHHVFTAGGAYIDGTVLCGHDLVVYGSVFVADTVQSGSNNNQFFGDKSPAVKWKEAATTKAESTVGPRANRRTQEIPTNKLCFSARTDEQYCTGDFVLPETRYAKIARSMGAPGLQEWSPVCEIPYGDGGNSYTYPGRNARLLMINDGYYDPQQGCAKDRNAVSNTSYTTVTLSMMAVPRPYE